MSPSNPLSTPPVNEWPIRFQFPVTWSCLSAPFTQFEPSVPSATRVAFDAPDVPGYETPPEGAQKALQGGGSQNSVQGTTHWEMVVPKMSRSPISAGAAAVPPSASQPAPVGAAKQPLALPQNPIAAEAPPIFSYFAAYPAQRKVLTAGEGATEAAGPGVLQRGREIISRAWRAVPQQVRVYAFSALFVALGIWVWSTQQPENGHWERETSVATSTGASERQLVVYQPKIQSYSERLEFDWKPDNRGVGIVYRAGSHDTYYATRITVVPASTTTALFADRFTVMKGTEGPHARKLIPLIGSTSMIEIRMEGSGPNFNLYVQGGLAESWSDNRLNGGGIGFYHDEEGLPSVGGVRLTFPGGAERPFTGTLASLLKDLR